jgi:hypothetical protein
MAPVIVFVTLCLTMFVFESKGDEHRLNYGIIFQKEKNLEFASENWIHSDGRSNSVNQLLWRTLSLVPFK